MFLHLEQITVVTESIRPDANTTVFFLIIWRLALHLVQHLLLIFTSLSPVLL